VDYSQKVKKLFTISNTKKALLVAFRIVSTAKISTINNFDEWYLTPLNKLKYLIYKGDFKDV